MKSVGAQAAIDRQRVQQLEEQVRTPLTTLYLFVGCVPSQPASQSPLCSIVVLHSCLYMLGRTRAVRATLKPFSLNSGVTLVLLCSYPQARQSREQLEKVLEEARRGGGRGGVCAAGSRRRRRSSRPRSSARRWRGSARSGKRRSAWPRPRRTWRGRGEQ